MAKAVQIFEAIDGKQFTSEAEANAYERMLENKELIEKYATSFVNATKAPNASRISDPVGMSGRARVSNLNSATAVIAFLIEAGVQLDADYVAIEPSEELAERLELDRIAAEEKAAKAKAKDEIVIEEVEADASMFEG